jgi:hypothetical protein
MSSSAAANGTAAAATALATSKRTAEDAIEPAAAKRPRLTEARQDQAAAASSHQHAAAYPTVSFHCLQRAQKTIQDVIQSYLFIFHTPEEPDSDSFSAVATAAAAMPVVTTHPSPQALERMFQLLPLLTYVSGTIYQMDEENEQWSAQRRDAVGSEPRPDASKPAASTNDQTSFDDHLPDPSIPPPLDSDPAPSSTAFSTLLAVLRSQGLLTPRIHTELQKGRVYWQLEREICEQLAQGRRPNLHEVHAASRSKSFDYRVLHLLMHGFLRSEPNEQLMSALAWNEQLVDLHDDLVDYEEDITSNSFNVYRCYVALYGEEAPMQIMARIHMMEQAFEKAMDALPPQMHRARSRFRLREHEAMHSSGRPGQDGSVWTIPQAILREAEWMEECRAAEQGDVRMRQEEEGHTGRDAPAASTATDMAVARSSSHT